MAIQDIRDITSFKWATVTGSNPVAIKLDGDTAPLALIPESLVDPAELVPGDRVRVELSLRKVVIHGRAAASSQGTTAQRNARFGTPATDAARVALANREIRWVNTDFGWEESYYAVTGLAGLSVRGLAAGVESGWYPIGEGPRAVAWGTSSQAAANGWVYDFWSFAAPGYLNGGADWFEIYDLNKTLRVKKAGRYRFDGSMTYPNGSGTGVASWRGNIPFGIIQFAVPLLGGFGQVVQQASPDMFLPVDGGVYFQTDSATWTIGGIDHHVFMSLKYLGPALVTD